MSENKDSYGFDFNDKYEDIIAAMQKRQEEEMIDIVSDSRLKTSGSSPSNKKSNKKQGKKQKRQNSKYNDICYKCFKRSRNRYKEKSIQRGL